MPGPPPKRSEERRRRNAPASGEVIKVDFEQVAGTVVEVPAPDDDWHDVAYRWYVSLTRSLQARFYEPSDWALAYMLADELSTELEPRPVQIGKDAEGGAIIRTMRVPMPGAKLNSILKGFSNLMVSEADRRRLAIETERSNHDDGEGATVSDITSDRRDLLG